jgi:hypothetical protein
MKIYSEGRFHTATYKRYCFYLTVFALFLSGCSARKWWSNEAVHFYRISLSGPLHEFGVFSMGLYSV